MKDFELLPHTADFKIRVYGTTLEELFVNALKGMFQSIQPRTTDCTYRNDRLVCKELPKKHTITTSSPDLESLLVDFLSEALYLSDTNNEAYLDATIHELNNTHINATLYGVAITGFALEIKAITYHDLKIEKIQNGWQAEIVFDI